METQRHFSHARWALIVILSAAALAPSTNNAAPADVILRAASATVIRGAWSVVADTSAAGGSRMANPNANAPKPSSAASAPASFFELTFPADAGVPYRLWIRGRAQGNSYDNDSVFVQFSDSVTSSGAATWRIGTTSATSYILEDCSGCNVQGWGWNDNGYGAGVLGPLVYFASSGTHTIRLQVREDGLSIDQIVLSPGTYLTTAPGATKNDTTILTGGGGPPPIVLVTEPYLQQVTDGSAIVVWASREPGPARVRAAGRNIDAVTTAFPAAQTGLGYDVYQHVATVDGLSPGTTYTYDVFVGSVDVNAGTDAFRTAPPTGTGSASFVIFGDSGTGSPEQRALAAIMAGDTFDLMLHAGDVAYGNSGGTGDATHATLQSWFFDIYRDILRRRPMFPSMGNHDSRASNNWGRAYLDRFVLPEQGGDGAYPDHAERYYSFDYGPVHFVAVDTERAFQDPARRAAQLAWLDSDLAATGQPWKVVYFHRAPYSSGLGHGSDLLVRSTLMPIFQRHGVHLVLSSHEHNYERIIPWREGSNLAERAIVNVVSGGGGGPLYDVGRAEWTAAARKAHHYVRVGISSCTATFHAIDRSGATVDRYVFDRCAQALDTAPPSVSITSPAAGATVSGTVTVDAAASDDVRVEKVDLYVDGAFAGSDAEAPYAFSWNTASAGGGGHTLEARAYDINGRRATATRSVTVSAAGASPDIVLRASDLEAAQLHGDWSVVSDATAADGVRLWSPNRGLKLTAAAAPGSYVDVTFTAQAGVPYHLWLRLKADSNSYENDSVSVQFSGTITSTGAAIYRIGTTSALSIILEEGSGAGVRQWGWNDNGYGTLGAPLTFATSGAQTIRIQIREDGASVDQIVLSPSRFFSNSPGALKDDTTVVAR
jgi:hypothetical protein